MWDSNRIHEKRILAFLICLFLILSDFIIANASENPHNKTVKAGIFYFEGYHMRDDEGNLTGYGIEFLNLASKYSHLNFTYIGYDKSWNDMLTMLENGEIDIVTSARKISEREKKFAFSLPIGKNSTILSIQANDTRFHSGDYSTYDGMKIGILTGSSQNLTLAEFAKEKHFSYQAKEYESSEQLALALKEGTIDAILSSNLRKTFDERTLDTLKTENFYAIVRKDDTELLKELNYAIEQINRNEGDWSNTLFYKYYQGGYSLQLDFTQREIDYIQDVLSGNTTITITAIGDHAPYSYVENGELKGIMPDYFKELMEFAGLPYNIIVPKDREDYYKMANTNYVDVVIDKRDSSTINENSPYHGFDTNIYMTTGIARVTKKNFSGKVKTVAIASAQDDIPLTLGLTGSAEILNYASREEALKAVLSGKADATYVYIYTAQLFVNNDFTDSLHYSIVDNVRLYFKMYIRDSCDHELVTILNKCIQRLPQDSFNQITAQYTSYYALKDLTFFQYVRANLGQVVVVILLGVILILLLWLRWKEKNFSEAEQSHRELEKQLAIVSALSRDYFNVFAVNTKERTARIVKMEGYVPSGLKSGSKESFSYSVILYRYIQERVHPEERQKLTEALSLDRIIEKLDSNTEYTGSYRVLTNGEVHTFQFTYVRIEEDTSQKDFSIFAGFRNIDDVVREEQKQKEILEEALAQAQHANHAKTIFLSNMSHDIRTPMNAIIGFASLAAAHIDNKSLIQNYLDKILTSSKHLLSLINDVLDMSRIESGKVTIEEQQTSLPEIVYELKTIVQSDIKSSQLSFYVDTLDVRNETIICDKLRLNQALLNILINSIKYTKPGGTVSLRIIQTTEASDGYASYQFKIKDTGIGISQEFLKHIFEPFEREQTATISGIQGSGLGLTITKKIIDKMNGTIEIESKRGIGTEFTVSFCFRIADSPRKTEHFEKFAGLRALVIDDDMDTCIYISKILSSIGLKPDWTRQGKEAIIRTELAVNEETPYQIYLISEQMPDIDGMEIVRNIRKILKDMPATILLTTYSQDDIEEEKEGVTAFCPKPIFRSELCSILMDSYSSVEPTEKINEQKEESEESVPSESFAGKKILLVEDIEINQEIAKAILEEAGFALDIVSDGIEAVNAMKQATDSTYDLILMDIQMPLMDGYEATRAIRSLDDSKRASIPIIALSANTFDEDKQKAIEAGMNGHVAKPIDVPTLLETLRNILYRKTKSEEKRNAKTT